MKVLLLDIETLPNLGYTWGMWQQNVIAIKDHWKICSYAAKFLGEKPITRCLADANERTLVGELWELLNEADLVIAHNGDRFDLPKINVRFAVHGLLPPSPYKTVDTKKAAKRFFGFTSNKLDHLCQQLGIGKKINTEGFELWELCMANDPKAWERMRKYNAHDIKLLEGLYYRLQPWIGDHASVFPSGCPVCGSAQIQARGTAMKQSRTYQRYQCQGCGKWLSSIKSTASQVYKNA